MRILISLAAMVIGAALYGQPSLTQRTYPPEDLLVDLNIVRTSLERAHPDPYRYITSTELDLLIQGIASNLTLPMTAEEFGQRLLPIFTAIGDGNTYLSPSSADMQVYQHTEPLLPVMVAVVDDKLFVVEELKGFSSFPTGSELLEVNGRSSKKIMEIIRSSLVPEGSDTTRLDRRIEEEFPLLYRRFVERAEAFHVTFMSPSGKVDNKVIFALTRDQMRTSRSRSGLRQLPWSLEMVPTLSTCWLTLGTMDRSTLERSRVDAKRFIDDARSVLRKSNAKTLVIDLRNASGDDMAMVDQVFSLIAQHPYQAFSAMSIRSGKVADPNKYSAPGPDFYVSLGAGYGPEVNGRRELKADDPRLQPKQPMSKAFTGKVYVICNGLTVDAAAAFVMMAKRTGRAHIVGEETGTNATSFCAGDPLKIELPRTDLILHIPLTRYVPYGTSGGAPNRGEMPDVQIAQEASALVNGADTVRQRLLELIGEMR